jgi:uncharacterized repeat protein (TIGR03803 family)
MARTALRGVVQGADGNFYGTTDNGGTNNYGSIFKITPDGTLTALESFCPDYGCTAVPSGLVQAANGDFYGTSVFGGRTTAERCSKSPLAAG